MHAFCFVSASTTLRPKYLRFPFILFLSPMASSSNPIAESATISSNYYHVFLNHRGSDVKETLATHLHKRLTDKGLRVFLDKEELQEGDNIPAQLKGAIGSASVHIAIFSPNYAESSWCLNELLLMLESRKTIIPIFYGVKPDVLRWTLSGNGVYARHLSILEGKKSIDSRTRLQKPRYDTNTMEEWRRALSQAADLTGFVVEAEAFNSDDNQLVDKVVERVLKKLPKTPLNVSKYPVGLDNKVKDLEGKVLIMPQQSGETRVVGIVGLGGVGKTTLAKHIFNRERSKYPRSCFLSDIRENAANGSLNSLLRTLVNELTGSEKQINSTAEGIDELGRRVLSCHAQAIIVLDDVDHIHQLDVLLFRVKDALSSSSLILITSRNRDVLTSFGIVETSIYHLERLNPQHSKELFCWHAFGQPQPAAQFQQVVQEFLDACQGLPLSLQVIGALLHGTDDLRDWKYQLQKISNILPEDIQSILKISYDGLDPEEKQIFLDIACFFTRERGNEENDLEIRPDRDTAIKIWDGSGWNGSLGLRRLQNRCLVDVEVDTYKKIEYLRMHDHLRDLGRDLAKKDPLGGHRLWRPTENLLHNLSDQSAVRGLLCLERNQLVDPRWDNRKRGRLLDQNPMELGNRSISMSRLELLRTPGDCLKDILRRVQSPEYLIWLHCHDFPFASLPRWIPMERLSVLYVQGDKLRWLWGDRSSQAPLQLRQLEITAPLLKFPKSIGQLKYLERIVVRPPECSVGDSGQKVIQKIPLETLPDEFCHLRCLEHLELCYCSEMESLPESFGDLKNLQHLDFSFCSKLRRLPHSLGNLARLQHFDLSGCSNLDMLPDIFKNLTGLQHMDLSGCSNLPMLPLSLGNLAGLQHFSLSRCSNLRKLPNSLRNLENLQHLDLSKYSNLDLLPYSFGNLRNLQHINLSECSNLQMLPNSLENLKNLQHIDLSRCSKLQILPNFFGNLKNLQHIDLSWCSNLRMLPNSFGNLTNLQHVDLSWCSSLPILPKSFGNLIQLRHLCLGECYDLTISSDTLGKIRTLEWLEISGCYGIEVLPPQVAHQRFLSEMYLFCPFLKELPSALGELRNLEILHLTSSCLELLEIETLVSLEELRTRECVKLKRIQGLAQLTRLRRLVVANCSELEHLAGVEHLRSLVKLDASECPKLQWSGGVVERLRQRLKECITS